MLFRCGKCTCFDIMSSYFLLFLAGGIGGGGEVSACSLFLNLHALKNNGSRGLIEIK